MSPALQSIKAGIKASMKTNLKPNLKTDKEKDKFAILSLLALSLIFFSRALLRGGVIYSRWSDVLSYYGPWRLFLSEYFKAHLSFPLWNPYTLGGTPLIANPLHEFFYPTIIPFLISPLRAFAFVYMLGLFTAGAFTYLFMRRLKAGYYGSIFSAITFMFSGVLIERIHRGHTNIVDTMVLLPLIFLLAEQTVRKKDIQSSIFLGLALGMQFLTGFPQATGYTIMALFLYFLYSLLTTAGSGSCAGSGNSHTISSSSTTTNPGTLTYPSLGSCKKYLLLFLLSLLIMAGLSAIQLLPGMEFMMNSQRGAGISLERSAGSFSYLLFATTIFPEIFGTLLNETCFLGMGLCSPALYVGILPLLFSLFSILYFRNRHTNYFILLAAFSILFLMGTKTPLYPILYKLLPGFSFFKGTAWIIFLYSFSISVLAGFGLSGILKAGKKFTPEFPWPKLLHVLLVLAILLPTAFLLTKPTIISIGENMARQSFQEAATLPGYTPLYNMDYYLSKVGLIYSQALKSLLILPIAMGAAYTILALSKKGISSKHIALLAIAILIFDLWAFGLKYTQVEQDTESLFGSTPEMEIMLNAQANTQDKFRILHLIDGYDFDSVIQKRTLTFKIEKVRGYDPIAIGRYTDYVNTMLGIAPGHDPSISDVHYPAMLDLLNVRYLTTVQEPRNYFLEDGSQKFQLRYGSPEDAQIKVYENINPLPRAFVVPEAKVMEPSEILQELQSAEFNPRQSVLLEEEIEATGEHVGEAKFSEAAILEYLPDQITLQTSSEAPAFLVLADNYYPGWHAAIDGSPAKVYRANYIQRAIQVPPGTHTITFQFIPTYFRLGAAITLLTLFFSISTILYLRKRE